MTPEERAMDELRKATMCLRLEVPQSIADDVHAKVEAVAGALREQIGRLQVEREQMKRTYDKRVEDLEKDYAVVRGNLLKSERRIAELEAQISEQASIIIEANHDANAARIEGLLKAKYVCQKQVHAIECILAIDAEIAALERGKEK